MNAERPLSFLISAPASGSGKTVVTMTLLSLLKRHGYAPAAFKAGPDYIDPAYHRAVLDIPSHNLDLFLSGEEGVRRVFSRYCAGRGSTIVEGAMGFYDGVTLGSASSSDRTNGSAYRTAKVLGLPVLLVVDAKGAAYSLLAQIKGMKDFRPDSGITMVLLNRCSEKVYTNIAPLIFPETGVLPVGFLPAAKEAAFPSRHLGLVGADEIADLFARVEAPERPQQKWCRKLRPVEKAQAPLQQMNGKKLIFILKFPSPPTAMTFFRPAPALPSPGTGPSPSSMRKISIFCGTWGRSFNSSLPWRMRAFRQIFPVSICRADIRSFFQMNSLKTFP